MNQRGKVAFLMLLTLGAILPLSMFFAAPAAHGMVRFQSYLDLQRFLLERSRCGYGYNNLFNGPSAMYGTPATFGRTTAYEFSDQSAQSYSSVTTAPSHSETNDQVAGVDELDSVKTDGQYIYTVTNNTIAIIDAYPVNDARLVSRISVGNQTIDGIFVQKNRLSIVGEAPRTGYYGYGYCGGANALILQPARFGHPIQSEFQNISIWVYDLSNRSSPTLQTQVTVNGTFVGARLINGLEYLVTSSPAKVNQSLPQVIINGHVREVQPAQIYHSDVSDAAFSYTTITALDLTQNNPTPKVETYLLGTSSTIYVSLTNIFLTQPTWESREETAIHRISIDNSGIKYEATGSVPGHVLNQFSMDEYAGYFRVVTSYNSFGGSQTSVYVLNSAMRLVGKLEALSPGEVFHAARFTGDRAYLVTFKRTDPLFVIDLQKPDRPALLGQLNVTGVSDYLQPYDTTHLIGIGKSAQDVAWENAALFQGLKISLFDVSSPSHPTDLSDFSVGDRGTESPALTDAKAVLFDRSLNLLVIPIAVVGQLPPGISPLGYSGFAFLGAFVFQVNPQNGIVLRGGITHLPTGMLPGYSDTPYTVTRMLYIGNVLYTISIAMVKMNSLTDLSELGSITLV